MSRSMCLCLISTFISLQVLLCGFASAQTAGFLSIDCGSDSPSLDDNGIQWIPDNGTIQAGEAIRIGDHINPLMSTMRVFKDNQSKYCYSLTSDAVVKGAFFLIRASFWPGTIPIYVPHSADGFFHFKYVIDGDEWRDLRLPYYQNSSWWSSEALVRAQGRNIYYCLARSAPDGDAPFISTLELRPLPATIFTSLLMNITNLFLSTYKRLDYGASSSTRYPLDTLDRVWFPFPTMDMTDTISTTTEIITKYSVNMPPPSVLQTAFVGKAVNNSFFTISFSGLDVNKFYVGEFYFAEIDPKVTAEKQRMFNIYMNGELWNTDEPIDIFKEVGAYTAHSRAAGSYPTKYGMLTYNFSATSNSSFPPLLCAAEYYRDSNITSFTLSSPSDVIAIEDIKSTMNLSSYTGDPCLPIQYGYSWLECTTSLSPASIPRITSISLSSFGVTGVIPKSISTLTMLSQISLDGNDLKGTIPDLSSLTVLVTLNLSNNNLNGSIPESLATLQSLKVVHLQNNNFSGVIPVALLERKKEGTLDFEYFGNQFLCEDACNSSVPATSPSVSTSPPVSTRGSMSTAVKVGVIAGVSIVVLLLVISGFFIVRFRTNKNTHKIKTQKPSDHQKQQVELQSLNPALDKLQPKLSIQEFNFHQMKVATNDFTTKLGMGRFGNVFKGKLEDERDVAIKVASSFINQQSKEFFNEVDLLSRVHHKNLVEFVGYCNKEALALIYEFMSNGSLFDCLHGKSARVSPLSWITRLSILTDAAQGLEYLHHGCNPPIIHRDIKSSNILLNEKMEAKISDFGISRENLLNENFAPSTTLMGTKGYIDPEYLSTMRMSKKVDVYSFGVLIFEVLCGKPPIFLDPSRQEILLVEWADYFIGQNSLEKILDGSLDDKYHAPSMWSVLEVAKECVQLSSSQRPNMSTVYNTLKEAKDTVVSHNFS